MEQPSTPTSDVADRDVFTPDRVAQLRDRLGSGEVTLDDSTVAELCATLDGLWGITARRDAGFTPLPAARYPGPIGNHWYRDAVTSGPQQIRRDAGYAAMTADELAVLAASADLDGATGVFAEPAEWDEFYDQLDATGA